MKLTDKEKTMLNGEEGLAVQKGMELLMDYGEALGAEKLIDTNNVHVLTPFYFYPDILNKYLDINDIDDFISKSVLNTDNKVIVDRVKAFTTSHIPAVDLEYFDLLEASKGRDPENFYDMVVKMQNYCTRIGINMSATCTPYTVGNVPIKGEHCAWTESSAISYANSVLGARTNIEGDHSSFASAITGKTVYWGMHLPKNRIGEIMIDVEAQPQDTMDWDLLGYYTGFKVGLKVPVYNHIKTTANMRKLMALCSAGAASGAVIMYHVIGITPEANTIAEVFGNKKPADTINYGKTERKESYNKLNCSNSDNIDFVLLGCPHYTIQEINYTANILEDKKVADGVKLFIFTNMQHKALAKKSGYLDTIERAGGKLIIDSCPLNVKISSSNVIATDSAKISHTSGGMKGWKNVCYGRTKECIEAAISGKWRGEL